ncbi:MAG: hypothetical protein ACI9S8_002413 [Chlamydiales bacterium]|jgi:hypothetical protein
MSLPTLSFCGVNFYEDREICRLFLERCHSDSDYRAAIIAVDYLAGIYPLHKEAQREHLAAYAWVAIKTKNDEAALPLIDRILAIEPYNHFYLHKRNEIFIRKVQNMEIKADMLDSFEFDMDKEVSVFDLPVRELIQILKYKPIPPKSCTEF